MEVYKNSGNGFEPFATIETEEGIRYLALEKEDKLIMASDYNIFEYLHVNSTYHENNRITVPSKIRRIGLYTELLMCAHDDGYIRFYRISDYGLEKAFMGGSSAVRGYSQANNGS